MKHIYWRPHGTSRPALALVAVLSLVGVFLVETYPRKTVQPFFEEKIRAARLADESLRLLKEERLARKLPADRDADPADSALIGLLMSEVTSNTGTLSAKQTSINPNFAAVVVQLLKRCEVQQGDVVAVGLSGSFPAINVSVYAALETLGARPVIITSASASSWGANVPKFLWIDMEKAMADARLISFRTAAASIGGVEDRGVGMSGEGISWLRRAIAADGLPFLDPTDYADSVNQRMAIYREQAGAAPIKAYINVGGGTTSVGTKIGKQAFKPGLNRRIPLQGPYMDSVMSRMIEDGVPVVHLVKIEELARRYGLPIQPLKTPRVGEGKIFFSEDYNPWLTAGVLAAILVALVAFIRSDWGFRILLTTRRHRGPRHPEPMV